MTIAKELTAKALVAVVAAAMVLSSFAASASAQTTEELQKMINELLAQVAALQGQAGQAGTSVAAGVCPYTWTRDLAQGAKGADVMKLQQFLNADADTRVAVTGAGSAGMETEFYGPATAAAVSKMQVKYRADILSPANLVNPTGYFGPSSRAKANSLCVTAPVVEEETASTTEEEEEEEIELSGEADLKSVEVEDADDTTIQEGETDVEVALVTVEFENGDAEVSRLDIKLDHSTSTRPWNVFESFSLWVDGDMITEVDADSKSDYIGSNDDMIRFSGLKLVAEEDEEVEIVIAATLKGSIKDADRGDWTITVESLRFFDADGVASTEDMATGDATITVELAGADDEVKIKRSSDDPKEDTLKVETGTTKSTHDIGVFLIEVGEDSSDVIVNSGEVDIKVSNPADATASINTGDVIDKVVVKVGSKSVTGKLDGSHATVATGSNATLTYKLDFNEFDLKADADYKTVVSVTFKGQNTDKYGNGVTVQALSDGGGWDIEGVDPITTKGTYTGKVHTLNSADVVFSDYGWTVNNTGTLIDFTFTVDADEEDFDVLTSSIASTTSGNATITAGVLSVVTGDANPINGGFKVLEGAATAATFRVRYTVSGANGTNAEVKITKVAGQTVPTDKQTSPTATLNVQN